MKLAFDSLTLGGGPDYFLEDYPSMDGKLNNIVVEVPRSDYSKNITDFIKPTVRVFKGTFKGSTPSDYRTKKRNLTNRIRKEYTFVLTDNYDDSGIDTEFDSYQFVGKIVEMSVRDITSCVGEYQIQIFSPDPMLYDTSLSTDTATVSIYGFTFPLTFPFIFSGDDEANQLVLNNTGKANVYPTIVITGACENLTIETSNSTAVSNLFVLTKPIPTDLDVTITPIPTDPVKIRDWNNNGILHYSNSNFDSLVLEPGSNTWNIYTTGEIDENTLVTVSFRSAYYSA